MQIENEEVQLLADNIIIYENSSKESAEKEGEKLLW